MKDICSLDVQCHRNLDRIIKLAGVLWVIHENPQVNSTSWPFMVYRGKNKKGLVESIFLFYFRRCDFR